MKTIVKAGNHAQDILITRDFNLPVALLFRAHAEQDLVAKWMTTNVVYFEPQPFGKWRYETPGPDGSIVFTAQGLFHEFIKDQKITRTFEMLNAPFGVQLEFLEFKGITEVSSRLEMHIIYRTAEMRDQMLRLPFAQGLNMAHNRLQDVGEKL